MPGKGKCKPWTGFVSLTAVPLGVSVHWYCCTASDGSGVTVSLAGSTISILALADAAYFRIDLPSMVVSVANDAQLGQGLGTSDAN
jgi:hypothetical protein